MTTIEIKNQRTSHYIIFSILCSIFLIGCDVAIENSFKEITGEDLPKKAQVILTEDSPKDVHGDYGRISVIKVGGGFYKELPKRLIQKGFKINTEAPNLSEFESKKKDIKLSEITFHYKFNGNNVYYDVGFYNDKESVVLIRSSW